jgi:competence protein ComEC
MVILSHFHADHVAGLSEVLAAYRPSQVVVSPLAEPPETYEQVRSVLSDAAVPDAVPQLGATYTVGSLSLQVIGPSRIPGEGSAPNNASLSIIATVNRVDGAGRHTVFLSGDLEPLGQSAVMGSVGAVDVDVAKVPHHGSAKQHPRFAGWTGAEVAVISCGRDNSYGHPSQEAIAMWQATGAQVARTDVSGDVIIAGDGSDGARPQVFAKSLPADSTDAG